MLAIVFAALRTRNELKKRVTVFASLIVGFVSSGIVAALRVLPNYINRTNLAFWIMIPVVFGFLFVGSILLAKRKLFAVDEALYENLFCAAVFLYAAFGICYYFPFIVTIAGTFVNYGESAVSTMVLFRITGYVLGILMILAVFAFLHNAFMRLAEKELTVAVLGMLSVLGITQGIVVVQRLYSLRIIPRNAFLFSCIAAVVNHMSCFIYAVVMFAFLPLIFLWKKNLVITVRYCNNAEHRKLRAKQRNAKRSAGFSVFLLLVSVLSLMVLPMYVNREVKLSPPENYTLAGDLAIIPLDSLEDGKLHRYEYITEDSIGIRFIILKKSEGSYGVALDACDICGPSGYFERGSDVVCKLCDVVMNKATIGFPGGCNPVPIPYIVHDKKIKIKVEHLAAEKQRFK